MNSFLSNDKVCLRALERDDLDALYLLENDMAAGGSSVVKQPVSRQLLWQYIESYTADINVDKQLRLVIADARDTSILVGAIDIYDYDAHDRRGFVGISVLDAVRGQGYGKAALELLCQYAAEVLGMHQLAAVVAADNESSRQLFTSTGFKTCGSLRSWLRRGKHYADALLFQKLFE